MEKKKKKITVDCSRYFRYRSTPALVVVEVKPDQRGNQSKRTCSLASDLPRRVGSAQNSNERLTMFSQRILVVQPSLGSVRTRQRFSVCSSRMIASVFVCTEEQYRDQDIAQQEPRASLPSSNKPCTDIHGTGYIHELGYRSLFYRKIPGKKPSFRLILILYGE